MRTGSWRSRWFRPDTLSEVLTDTSGPVEIDVPRNQAPLEPRIVHEPRCRLSGVDEVMPCRTPKCSLLRFR